MTEVGCVGGINGDGRKDAHGSMSEAAAPTQRKSRGAHPVDEVLSRCHGLAIDLAMRRDTS